MRHGIPPAGNFLHQELAIAHRRRRGDGRRRAVHHAGPGRRRRSSFHTKLITTSPKAKIDGADALRVRRASRLRDRQARSCARPSTTTRTAARCTSRDIRRATRRRLLPRVPPLHAGRLLSRLASVRSTTPSSAGRIRGLAAVVGCNNAARHPGRGASSRWSASSSKRRAGRGHRLRRHGRRKYGYSAPGDHGRTPAPGCARSARPSASRRCCTSAPAWTTPASSPILTSSPTEGGLGEDIADMPAVGICPEWMSREGSAIGSYSSASGAYVLFG